ncbi:radical SAM family heme chaperone HemW [Caldicellulosiruptor morganii]|uniref:Heme chaperone HemW n=1 Tax=Caldicellulosiruptor morganii TaxID=1387555 RepID=A0ABY7BM83_9FIRM|nr:radical SAM family heme chaperone HemW [Caldicellulosiruptor morganii]WAM32987.1 radical SAM family heme chaperone HemW [Caldicellulosiruptor morganii]
MSRNVGLYIHIPFCMKKCFYCDFVSFSDVEDDIIAEYFSSLKRELIFYKENYDIKIDTIYIGGGTPSVVAISHIGSLLEFVYCNFKVENYCETTIEANPESLDEEKIKFYCSSGINRLSVGIQSLNDVELKALGRIHTSKRALEMLELVTKYFENFSVDLMIGIVHQSIESFSDTLGKVLKVNPPHVSVYSLKIEEGTHFYNRYESIKSHLPSEEEERNMYWFAVQTLYSSGIHHYEISNFAKENFKCKHNLKYWDYEEYIGIGCAAHSFFDGYRYFNTASLEDYISRIKNGEFAWEDRQLIDDFEKEKEYIILGLRKIEGFELSEFERRFNVVFTEKYKTQIEKLKRYGLVEINSHFKLTKKGIDLANIVWQEFI